MQFGNAGFCGGRKTGVAGEKLSEQEQEPPTDMIYIGGSGECALFPHPCNGFCWKV